MSGFQTSTKHADGLISQAEEQMLSMSDPEDDVFDEEEVDECVPVSQQPVRKVLQEKTSEVLNYNTMEQQPRQDLSFQKQQQQMYQTEELQDQQAEEEEFEQDPEYEADFKSAYQKLVSKIYEEQGPNILLSQEEIHNTLLEKKFNVDEFSKRIQQDLEKKQLKQQMMRDIKEQEALKDCTFKPKTNKTRQGSQRRTFDQFYSDQRKFVEAVENKREEIKIEKENIQREAYTLKPKVDKQSSKIFKQAKEKDEQQSNVYDRLHKISQMKLLKKKKEQGFKPMDAQTGGQLTRTRSENTFQSNFASVQTQREKSRDPLQSYLKETQPARQLANNTKSATRCQRLYQNAQNRFESMEQKKERIESEQREKLEAQKTKISSISIKYTKQKFEREFKQMIEQKYQEQKMLNYLNLTDLLACLGFLNLRKQEDASTVEMQERELLFDMWTILEGESRSGIHRQNILSFLYAILGISKDISKMQNLNLGGKFGEFDERGKFMINTQEAQKIFVKFKLFYINRMHHIGNEKRDASIEPDITFKPQVNKNSIQLAEAKRRRIIQKEEEEEGFPIDQNKKIVEILLCTKELEQKEQWRNAMKQQREDKEIAECTFQPKITKYEADYNTTRPISNGYSFDTTTKNQTYNQEKKEKGKNKCIDLYEKAVIQRVPKRDKTTADIEFEKGIKELTFQPDIGKSQNNFTQLHQTRLGQKEDLSQIPGFDKITQRMKQGRKEAKFKQMIHERGIPAQMKEKKKLELQLYNSTKPPKSSSNLKSCKSTRDIRKPFNFAEKPQQQNYESNGSSFCNAQFEQEVQNPLKHVPVAPKPKKIKAQNKQRANLSLKELAELKEKERRAQEKAQKRKEEDSRSDQEKTASQSEDEQAPPKPTQNVDGVQTPLLYVDVNLGPNHTERIVVYEGETACELAKYFANKHNLNPGMVGKLTELLEQQMSSLLECIAEEEGTTSGQDD